MSAEQLTDGLPLSGFRVGVTAARKVDEQIGLLERRGAAVEWAPALSLDPNQIDDERAARRHRGGAELGRSTCSWRPPASA